MLNYKFETKYTAILCIVKHGLIVGSSSNYST